MNQDKLNNKKRQIELYRIAKLICEYYSIDIEKFFSRSRVEPLARARIMFCFFIYKMGVTTRSFTHEEIGLYLNKANHCPSVHACIKVDGELSRPVIKETVIEVTNIIDLLLENSIEPKKISSIFA